MSYNFPEFTKGQIGELTYDQLNAAFAILEDVAPLLPFLHRLKRQRKQPQPNPWFEAEITGHTALDSSTNRWLYSWRKVTWNPNDRVYQPLMKPVVSAGGGGGVRPPVGGPVGTGAIDPSGIPTRPTTGSTTLAEINSTLNGDPFALAAVNGCENANVNGGNVGPGVNTGNTSYVDCNLEVKPISNGVVVPMFHTHGKLSQLQVTGNRSVFAYMFSLGNAHDRGDAP